MLWVRPASAPARLARSTTDPITAAFGPWGIRRRGIRRGLDGIGCRRLRFPDLADEAESLARDGADQALLLAAVADRLAHRVDVAGQSRFGNDASGPDRVQKGILADDVLAVLHEVKQQIEDLRADRNDLGSRVSSRRSGSSE